MRRYVGQQPSLVRGERPARTRSGTRRPGQVELAAQAGQRGGELRCAESRTQVGRERRAGRIEQRDFALGHSPPQVRGQRDHVGTLLESEIGEQPAGHRVRQRLMPRLLGHVVHGDILAALPGGCTDVSGVTA